MRDESRIGFYKLSTNKGIDTIVKGCYNPNCKDKVAIIQTVKIVMLLDTHLIVQMVVVGCQNGIFLKKQK